MQKLRSSKWQVARALLATLFWTVTAPAAHAQVNVPDANFRAKLSADYSITFDASNNISNPAAAAAITLLELDGTSISDLTGIEAFTGLDTLDCSDSQLTTLDVSMNTALTYLNCRNNRLTSLNLPASVALRDLRCNENDLTSLDISMNTALTFLDCDNNKLTTLDISKNTALTKIDIGDNPLLTTVFVWTLPFPPATVTVFFDNGTGPAVYSLPPVNVPDAAFRAKLASTYSITFDAGNNITNLAVAAAITSMEVISLGISNLTGIEAFTGLTTLNCRSNQLTSLNTSTNTALTNLNCSNNQLANLNLSANTALEILDCGNNQLTSLNVGASTALTELYCFNNNLTSLDISQNTALIGVSCDNNSLTSLDVSPNTALTQVSCTTNQLISLNISANPALIDLYCFNNNLTSLDISQNTALQRLYCNNNQLSTLDLSANTALTELSIGGNPSLDTVVVWVLPFPPASITIFNDAGTAPAVYVIATSSISDALPGVTPQAFALQQNYPNPFNPSTTIRFALPNAAKVSLKIYDLLGREVQTLVNETKAAGYYQLPFNASNLSSGTYFYRLSARSSGSQTGAFVETKRMLLVK